jgi:hypothetical protein
MNNIKAITLSAAWLDQKKLPPFRHGHEFVTFTMEPFYYLPFVLTELVRLGVAVYSGKEKEEDANQVTEFYACHL